MEQPQADMPSSLTLLFAVAGGAAVGNLYARVIAFAVTQPADVDVDEIVFRPTAQDI